MTSYINNKDIFTRTQVGAKELENCRDSQLPREARTLLIMIDGQKSYEHVAEMLEHRNLYKSTGIRPYMQMLVDLEYVACQPSERVVSHQPARSSDTTALSDKTSSQEKPSQEKPSREKSRQKKSIAIESEITSIKNDQDINKRNRLDDLHKVTSNTLPRTRRRILSSNQPAKISIRSSLPATDTLRNIVSTLITKHASPQQANIYNKRLTNCNDMRCLFEVIQEMQRASSDELELALYLAAQAFKKSKVAKATQLSVSQTNHLLN